MSDLPDLDALFQQAMAMQEQLVAAQAEAQATEVEGRAGGGSVRVTMTGGGEVTRIRIDPSVVDPNEVDLLEDLLLAALRDAATKAQEVQSDAMGGLGALAGGLNDLGGLDLGDLAGLVGGAPPGGEAGGARGALGSGAAGGSAGGRATDDDPDDARGG
jgi:DNA-binding YbaB/EbfC family protein